MALRAGLPEEVPDEHYFASQPCRGAQREEILIDMNVA